MLDRRLLAALHAPEDLPGLTAALGYRPAWEELPARQAIAGASGDFRWISVPPSSPQRLSREAARMARAGRHGGIMGLDGAARRLVIAVADAPPLVLSLDCPAPLDLARLERCHACPGESGIATALRIAEALSTAGVDDRFYRQFRKTLAATMEALPGRLPLPDRHALALLQLTRILFLYFLQAKGWLDARHRFLAEEVDRCLGGRRSLHRHLLQPLFFGTLNRPATDRTRLARAFGRVPFLNGGLFEPHPLERRWKAVLPTPVLRDAFDTLFERFHFTLAPTAEVAIAPDMLGRVFERVMDPGARHASGSYYTPAALVDRLLADGIATWLAGRLKVSWPEASRRLSDPDAATWRALRTARLLDPAAGSGAFLVGALRVLSGGRSARRPGRLRRVLREQLFGVDRNAAAVRLAELRLWLEVVAAEPADALETVAPLPNLDALVRQGDSLQDPATGLSLPPPPPEAAREIGTLRRQVVEASGPGKRHATALLVRAERRMAREALTRRLEVHESAVAEILAAAKAPMLFGGRHGLSRDAGAALRRHRSHRRLARQELRTMDRTGEVPWFHYPVHFADVMAAGGFDLVVGNPPWVRAEHLDRPTRDRLAERYRWFRGSRSAGGGYVHQPDLAVAFLERSLELLAPGGVLAMLVPAKLATTGYGAAAREGLSRRNTLSVAEPIPNDEGSRFEATVYPLALVATHAPPPSGHRLRTGLGASTGRLPQASLGAAPWALGAGAAIDVAARLQARHPRLGDSITCHLGVKTGLNEAFLDPPADVEPAVLRLAVRGRDLAPFRASPRHRFLFPCDGSGRPLAELPPAAAAHIAGYASRLRRRADHEGGPPWTLFRTGPAMAEHRVVWPDLARRLAAVPLSGTGARTLVPLNTCYVAVLPDAGAAHALAAWLNSQWCRALAALTADPASGGFLRFNARVVAALPLPDGTLQDATLAELGRRGAAGADVQEAINDHCAGLLALDHAGREALAATRRRGPPPGPRSAGRLASATAPSPCGTGGVVPGPRPPA